MSEPYLADAILTAIYDNCLPCDECGQPITTSQVECRAGGTRLHQWCHYAKLQGADRQPAAVKQEVA